MAQTAKGRIMAYRIGIDAGSKTIKIVVVDEAGTIVHSIYRRHRFDIRTTVRDVVHDLVWRYGDIEGTVGVTGSAGIGFAETLDLPFVQEVIATTRAVRDTYPQADAIIELGGEDAKIVYLKGTLEQRMNATCAGGTGGFIDTIAFRIGARSAEMSNLALRANRIYPIASRCAVFAETDVRPLLNAGASAGDIAASALEAVVRQTVGGLACGRPIEGTVVFLGGPLEHIPDLVRRFRKALGLTAATGIKPPDAHLFTALGAALHCSDSGNARTVSLARLEQLIDAAPNPRNDLPRLEPLFENDAEVEAFRKRHRGNALPRKRPYDAQGPVYVGIDAGSTAVKIAAIDDDGNLVYSDYHPTEGDVLATTLDMIDRLYVNLPRTHNGEPLARIVHATATGYGENLLRAGLGVDSGVVETTAHATAALRFMPDLTFLLDIGGQDIKAIWVNNGAVEETVLNEACSSGCGSFIEGMAHSLRSTPERFAAQALSATAPVDLGTKCTVFMTSRIRHAQKAGASVNDLAAGAAYSVVRNALFRIIGVENLGSLGNRIVVQGGAFASDAVLRAFEKMTGLEVIRPGDARLMGAIGAALIARNRAHEASLRTGKAPLSTIIAREAIASFKPKRRTMRCSGCANSCELSIVSFGNGASFISGNRCDRAEECIGLDKADRVTTSRRLARAGDDALKLHPPNALALEQGLLARYRSIDGNEARGDVAVGIVGALRPYDQLPFWHKLVAHLGFSVIVPSSLQTADSPDRLFEGLDTIPSESVCYPAKLSHVRLHEVIRKGATAVLAPRFARGSRCPVSCEYAEALRDSVPALQSGDVTLCAPLLQTCSPERASASSADRDSLFESLAKIAPPHAPLERDEFDEAFAQAVVTYRRFRNAMARGNERAIAWAQKPGRHGIVIGGRAYHADPDVLHSIDEVLEELGFSVIAGEMLDLPAAKAPGNQPWAPAKHAARLAQFAIDHPSIDLVYLQSFGCGYDAMSIPDARAILRAAGRQLTALKIDDIADTAHLRIRLRTLAETIERAEAHREIGCSVGIAEAHGAAQREVHPTDPPVARPATDAMIAAARAGDTQAFNDLGPDDVSTARMHVNDVCYVLSALAGRAIRIVAGCPDLKQLAVPMTCTDCLADGLARVVERASGQSLDIVWEAPGPTEASAPAEGRSSATDAPQRGAGKRRPLIGIIGAPPLVGNPRLNDDIASFIAESGCDVALPDPSLLAIEDIRYLDQLDRFACEGVDHVIYLLSFGCLKGHIHARGAARALERRYPNMPITVVDYDPEASALNRENRIRLALESARARCEGSA